jgi:hypothetical protein
VVSIGGERGVAATVGAGVALEQWIRRADPVARSWHRDGGRGRGTGTVDLDGDGKRGGGTVDLDGGGGDPEDQHHCGGISTATACLPRRI